MTFPLINYIYEFENKEVLVLATVHFCSVMILQYSNDEYQNSEIKTVNWFKFMFKAKKLHKNNDMNQ